MNENVFSNTSNNISDNMEKRELNQSYQPYPCEYSKKSSRSSVSITDFSSCKSLTFTLLNSIYHYFSLRLSLNIYLVGKINYLKITFNYDYYYYYTSFAITEIISLHAKHITNKN